MSRNYDVVVIGAGSAGFSAAAAARETSPTASILLINDEDTPPYDRTLLSKSFDIRNGDLAKPLKDEGWFAEQGIDRIDGMRAARIDRTNKVISLEDGTVGYGAAVIATGAEPLFPKVIRHHERGSFFVVRNARDVREVQQKIGKAKTILVAGMGVLAVEVAYQLVQQGKSVSLAGATPQLIPRQLSARAGELLEEAMTSKALKLYFQEEIISFEQNKKHSWSVEMLKHSAHYDMVIFCIGVTSRVVIAEDAGLTVARGIKVDDTLRTDDPAVFAAGDCAELPDGRISFLWDEAAAQGAVAGTNAAGGDAVYENRQFPLKTSIFGVDIFSVGKPAAPWEYDIEEFEVGNRYYAYYWDRDDTLRGAVILNDTDFAETVDTAVRERWDRRKLEEIRAR